jgi:RNA polymerase sigma factor (sigma-70 family)
MSDSEDMMDAPRALRDEVPSGDLVRTSHELPSTDVRAAPDIKTHPIGAGGLMVLWTGYLFFGLCNAAIYVGGGAFLIIMVVLMCTLLGSGIHHVSHDTVMASLASGLLLGVSSFIILALVYCVRFLLKHDMEERQQRSMKRTVALQMTMSALVIFLCSYLPLSMLAQPWLICACAVFQACMVAMIYFWLGGRLTWTILKSSYKAAFRSPFWAGVWSTVSNAVLGVLMVGLFGLHECSQAGSEMSMSSRDSDSFGDYFHSLDLDVPSRRFDDCFSTLHTQETVPQIHRLSSRKQIPEADAEDIVHDVLLRVCTSHSKKPKRELTPYFVKSVSHAAVDYKTSYDRRMGVTPCQWERIGERIRDPYDPLFARLDLEKTLCKLDTTEQTMLTYMLHNYATADIAHDLGLSKDAVRQRRSRLINKLRRTLE